MFVNALARWVTTHGAIEDSMRISIGSLDEGERFLPNGSDTLNVV